MHLSSSTSIKDVRNGWNPSKCQEKEENKMDETCSI